MAVHPAYQRQGIGTHLAEPLTGSFSGVAWIALELAPGALAGGVGRVEYPPPFGILEP